MLNSTQEVLLFLQELYLQFWMKCFENCCTLFYWDLLGGYSFLIHHGRLLLFCVLHQCIFILLLIGGMHQNLLTKEQWINLLNFVKAIDGKLFVSFANCPGNHKADEPWDTTQAKLLMDTSIEHGVPVSAAEFTNEPNLITLSGLPQGYTAADCMEHIWDYFPDPSMQRYILTTRIPVQNVKETLLLHNRPVDKVHGVFRNPEEKEKARQRVRTISEIEVTGAFFHNLEVNAKGVTKGQALLRLGEMLGIKREEIMACGDGMNDYEMLSAVGFGVAMGNAMEPLKEIADYITETNDENGVAKAIEKFVLRREGE